MTREIFWWPLDVLYTVELGPKSTPPYFSSTLYTMIHFVCPKRQSSPVCYDGVSDPQLV